MNDQELIKLAIEARELSYSPYSKFQVGAVVLCRNGKTYKGANVENASYPLCMCGERNAIYHALMEGEKKEDIIALAIVGDTPSFVSPCGACRQVIHELLNKDTRIILSNLKGDVKITSPDDLLPYAFNSGDLD